MPALFIAIWSIDTVSQTPGSWLLKSFTEKLAGLRLVVDAFNHARRTYSPGSLGSVHTSDVVRAVFAAPEYLFAGVNEDKDRDYLSQSQLKLFQGLVPGPADTLLVPGSFAYRKQGTTPRREKYLLEEPGAAARWQARRLQCDAALRHCLADPHASLSGDSSLTSSGSAPKWMAMRLNAEPRGALRAARGSGFRPRLRTSPPARALRRSARCAGA